MILPLADRPYAEEEARSASENQKWRIHKLFEQGLANTGKMLGYRLKDGVLVIVPEEAEIVRRIYSDYLSGMGRNRIARALTDEGVPKFSGERWNGTAIAKILTNEKYKGDMLLQKRYRVDFRSKTEKINHGELRKYYVENSHEAIISKETFDAVQDEIVRRKKKYCPPTSMENREADDRIFTGLIRCGTCGRIYTRKHTNAKKYDKIVWICRGYYEMSTSSCDAQKIPETILMKKTKEVLGIDLLTRDMVSERIKEIIIPAHNHLTFVLKDGSSIGTEWKHPSRSESWTPEMRQAARVKALKQHEKRRHK